MKLDVGKVVDHMIWESYIPTDSVKSENDDYFNLVHNIGTEAYNDSDNTNLAYFVG